MKRLSICIGLVVVFLLASLAQSTGAAGRKVINVTNVVGGKIVITATNVPR